MQETRTISRRGLLAAAAGGTAAAGVQGRDPVDYLTGRYEQSRWPLFHVKDRTATGDFADPGTGTINFRRIFRVLENKHYHHYLVERDTLVHQEETARVGYEFLRSLRGRRLRTRC